MEPDTSGAACASPSRLQRAVVYHLWLRIVPEFGLEDYVNRSSEFVSVHVMFANPQSIRLKNILLNSRYLHIAYSSDYTYDILISNT
eukprot:Skav207904  [mRNA]  locus=scaffold190:82133:82393:- [translate_table: standard]